ncbi:MAG TPA: 8-amino-7-oxononanoate synthase [Candidatus Dormibacteraeota bacterium]|nr:8-amino-7-oxononanoate synthase [Candidatus Dormibacteraeota bacterium]
MPSDSQSLLLKDLESALYALELRTQRRALTEIRGVNLCSNDYLGLSESPALRQAVIDAVAATSRVGATGSRLLSGHTQDWENLEDEFARFAGTESALFFGSGYAANLGLIASLVAQDDVVFSDELNHASIIDGIRLSKARKIIYPHLDLHALEAVLRAEAGSRGRKVVVTESVFSMDGDIAPLEKIVDLAERYDAVVIVDEAHATGVHGERGRGLAAAADEIAGRVFAVVHTCGKALASAGAFVCGSKVLKEHLINHARTFIFSTALPPYIAGQIRAAMRLSNAMDQQRAFLLENAKKFAAALRNDGWKVSETESQIVPVIIGGNAETLAAAAELQEKGFAVKAIRPPTVAAGQSRLRLSLTTLISPEELTRLHTALTGWRTKNMHAAGCRA